jgi:plasmid stability protein
MDLTIKVPDNDVQALRAKATQRGVSAEEYALQVLEEDLAPEWLRKSWETAREAGLDQLSPDEIDGEIAAARKGTGADLVAAMQASPYREIDLEPGRTPMPVRGVTF